MSLYLKHISETKKNIQIPSTRLPACLTARAAVVIALSLSVQHYTGNTLRYKQIHFNTCKNIRI